MDAAQFYTLDDLNQWSETGGLLVPPAKLSVFGNPVAHSLSPNLHNPALKACGIDAQYIRILVEDADFSTALKRIHELGFIGTNVTIPHKFNALRAVDVLDERARRLGAVNTVVFRDGKAHGFNSDGPGFVRTVEEAFGVSLKNLRIAIVGAGGGAGRAVAVQCALEQCVRLALVNRTQDKILQLADEIGEFYPAGQLTCHEWCADSLAALLPEVDLIVNGTNLGMQPDDAPVVPKELIESRHCVYDMVYKPLETVLLRDAKAQGARTVNGLAMLLHQGCVSFEWWFNRPAPVEIMREALYAKVV